MNNGYDYAGLHELAEPVHQAALEFADSQGAGVIAEKAGLELSDTLAALDDLHGVKLVTKYSDGGRTKWYASRKKARINNNIATGKKPGNAAKTKPVEDEKTKAQEKAVSTDGFDEVFARLDAEMARLDADIKTLTARRGDIETARRVLAGL